MRRFSFLTVFLGALSVAFVIALVVRLRSYGGQPPPAVQPSSTSSATPSSTQTTDRGGPLSSTAAIVNGAARQENATVVATASQRAKLREELLRAPIASATTASAPVAAPSPVPMPVTATQPRPAASATPRPAVPRPSPVPQPIMNPSAPRSTQPSQATSTAPKDPNSDTLPPQLLGIEFDPQQVQDGQEARVIMNAVDDMSGVRGISGTITSPTGKALQGFAGQREGDTTRFVGRFTVPKNGEEGLWRVNVITMSDNASNSITLSLAQGTLPGNTGLRVVSSQSDSTPPTLKSARAEKRSMHIGEPNPIYIEAEDDKSGVNLVSAVFQSPTKKARIGAGCARGDGDLWKCEMSLPQCIDCGDWQLEQVTLQDKANNLATFRIDNPIVAAVKVNIGGDSCDSEAPRLHGIVFDQNVVTMTGDPATVTVTMTATDDACGVEGVSAQFTGPGTGTGGFFALQRAGDEQTWVGKIPLDPRAPRGTWRLTSVQLTDKGHNLRIYYVNDPLLANAIFQVR